MSKMHHFLILSVETNSCFSLLFVSSFSQYVSIFNTIIDEESIVIPCFILAFYLVPHYSQAWGSEFDLKTNTVRAVVIYSDTFCSAGAWLANGTLIETGGDKTGVIYCLYNTYI